VLARNKMNVAHPHSLAIIVTGTHHQIAGSMLDRWDGEIAAAIAFEADPARLPPELAKRVDSMTTLATFDVVPDGPISACAVALPARISDFMSEHLFEILDKTMLDCTPVADGDGTVVVSVSPLPRID
jgi:hypothetical protein